MTTTLSAWSDPGADLFQAELMQGETLLWTGQPLRKVIFHSSDLFTIPFSFIWGGFAIFWEIGVSGGGHRAPAFMVLWGIPFVVMGQYFIWGRFFYQSWKKKRTFYAVTNKRILVLSFGRTSRLVSAYLSELDSVALSERRDAIGTLQFSPEPARVYSWGRRQYGRDNGFGNDADLSRLMFYDIAKAREIYQMIQTQREVARHEIELGLNVGTRTSEVVRPSSR